MKLIKRRITDIFYWSARRESNPQPSESESALILFASFYMIAQINVSKPFRGFSLIVSFNEILLSKAAFAKIVVNVLSILLCDF